MHSRMRMGALAVLLSIGCSPTPAPPTAGIEVGAGIVNSAEPTAIRARSPGSSPGDARQHQTDILLLAARSRDVRLALRAQARLLAGRTDGRSQLAAAWLLQMARNHDDGQDRARSEDDAALAALLMRAGELAPDDALVAWLELVGCRDSRPPCRPELALARLQRLQPDNSAAWLAALEDAVDGGDQDAIDRTLDLAGRASYFDSYWGEAGHFLDATLADAPLPPRSAAVLDAQRSQAGGAAAPSDRDERSMMAMNAASSVGMPGLAPLMRNCRRDNTALTPSRRSSCLAVAALLAGSDTLLGRRIGLGLAVRLTADASEGAALRERLRRFLWLQEQVRGMGYQPPSGYTRSVWRLGEVAALQAWTTSVGRPLTPPPGWLPGNREERALVTTGRPPPRG